MVEPMPLPDAATLNTPMWRFRYALGSYDFVTSFLVQRMSDIPMLKEVASGNDAVVLLQRLGISRPCRAPDTITSGLEILVDEAGVILWLVVPVWESGRNTGVVLQFGYSYPPGGSERLTLTYVGPGSDAPTLPGSPAEADVRAALVEHEAYMVRRAQESALWYAVLHQEDPPDVPDDVRPLATAILAAVVERRLQDVWLLGGRQGMSPAAIERVLQQAELVEVWPPPDPSQIMFVVPPQGLPPNMDTLAFEDGSGYHLEIPLWSTVAQTDLLLIVIARRGESSLNAYLYDIRDLE